MNFYIENLKDTTKNKFNKGSDCKFNIQRSVTFQYTNKPSEKEIKKAIPFIIASKNEIFCMREN
jgi:hypothetical protein